MGCFFWHKTGDLEEAKSVSTQLQSRVLQKQGWTVCGSGAASKPVVSIWQQPGMLPCILALLVFIDGSNTSPVADPDVLEGSPSAELPLQPKAGAGCADLLYKTEPHWQAGSAQQLEPSSWTAGLRSTACLNCDNSCLTVPWVWALEGFNHDWLERMMLTWTQGQSALFRARVRGYHVVLSIELFL